MSQNLRHLLLCVLGTLTYAPLLDAQTPTSALTGLVRDSLGRSVVDATVVATGVETGLTYRTRTGATGEYWLRGLHPSPYDVTVSRIGYGPVTRKGVPLVVGQTVTLNVVLNTQLTALDPIVVVGDLPVIETTQSDVSYTFERSRVENLPEESRRFLDLALLTPGATTALVGVEQSPGVQIGALNQNSLGILVDGGSLVFGTGMGQYAGSFPLLAVQEFEVLSAAYSAEFGQAASGIINAVTRRGTNSFQAEAFGLYRNHRFNARGAFDDTKPAFNRTHGGVAFGGPLQRNRTHLFVAFERKVENSFVTVDTDGAFPQFEGTFRTPYDNNLLFARLDHRFSNAHELMVRYGADLSNTRTDIGPNGFCPMNAPNHGVDIDQNGQSLLARHRWQLNEHVTNEATIHYTRSSYARTRLDNGPLRSYQFVVCTGGNFFAWRGRSWRTELKEAVSMVTSGATGVHRLKIGAQINLLDMDHVGGNNEIGWFAYFNSNDPLPFQFLQFARPPTADERSAQVALFVQDDWSPTPTLTFNLGLRYDLETNGSNQGFENPTLAPLPFGVETRNSDFDNIAPRIGFAWDPTGEGRTVVRGGFGVFYDQLRVWLAGLETSGGQVVFIPNPGTNDVDSLNIDLTAIPELGIVLDSVTRTPFTRQYSFGVEHLLPGGLRFRADGQIVQGRNLTLTLERNPFTDATRTARQFPSHAGITQYTNRGEAEAKILTLGSSKVFTWGRFDAHYTLADRKNMADVWYLPSPIADPTELPSLWGPAAWDERHRIVVLGDAMLPAGVGASLKAVYSSARPFTAATQQDVDRDGNTPDLPLDETRGAHRGFDYFNVDIGLRASIPMGASRLDMHLNVYNVLNRTNYDSNSIVTNVDNNNPLFGQALGALPKRQVEIGLEVRY